MKYLTLIFLPLLLLLCPYNASESQCLVTPVYSPYHDIEKTIVEHFSEAKSSITCSLYGITNRAITNVLKQKQKEGVKAKLLLDRGQSKGKRSTHRELEAAGVTVVVKPTYTLQHNKACLVDSQTVITGSWNFSESANKQDNNMVIIEDCPEVAESFNEALQRIEERDTCSQKH